MRYTCEIDLDNEAFQPEPGPELGRILMRVGAAIADVGVEPGEGHPLLDVNGTTVGSWAVIEETTCAVCGVAIERRSEEHWRGWVDASGDQLSYVPHLHDHAPGQ